MAPGKLTKAPAIVWFHPGQGNSSPPHLILRDPPPASRNNLPVDAVGTHLPIAPRHRVQSSVVVAFCPDNGTSTLPISYMFDSRRGFRPQAGAAGRGSPS